MIRRPEAGRNRPAPLGDEKSRQKKAAKRIRNSAVMKKPSSSAMTAKIESPMTSAGTGISAGVAETQAEEPSGTDG